MIVEFSVGNFRSINEVQTLSFATTGLKSAEKHSYIDKNNVVKTNHESLFKTIGVYGANASGKSNVVKALNEFVRSIAAQPSSESNLGVLCQPFLYQENAEKTDSFFQIVLIVDGVKYRYGFTVRKVRQGNENGLDGNEDVITSEWLYADKAKNMSCLFQRKGQEIIKNNLKPKSKIPATIPFNHTLYLTHAAAFDSIGDCFVVSDFLRGGYIANFDFDCDKFRQFSIVQIKRYQRGKKTFLDILHAFGLKYLDISLDEDISENKGVIFPQDKIYLTKENIVNGKPFQVSLNLKRNESTGTQKMVDLAGLLWGTFNLRRTPGIIVLDEIDNNFHPSLLIKLINMFNDPNINKSNSQLLFTSHDTNLLSPSIMRRDQFYFTEKKADDSTRLYSLAELRGIRNDADFAKDYLAGYYGATPSLESYCSPENSEDNE